MKKLLSNKNLNDNILTKGGLQKLNEKNKTLST